VHLRGVDAFGAMAAITGASESGFTVSGVFRDAADFAVLYLYDADDYFGHPRLKYLPDFDLSGLVLSFDVTYTGLQPLDSDSFPTIDWPYLDAILSDGSTAQVSLFANATQVGGNYVAAQTVLELTAGPAVAFDRVTIWYQNYAYDYIAAGGETAAAVAALLAGYINATAWDGAHAISAVASGATITVTSEKAGTDGNFITLYSESKTSTLTVNPAVAPLTGGNSSATWNIQLDFTSLGLTSVRQLWLTFAPALAIAAAYESTEWTAVFTNWSLTGAGSKTLQVAGPGSVRVEDSSAWCTYTGSSWSVVDTSVGNWSRGFAHQVTNPGDSVTVACYCQSAHDLYLGTALEFGYGTFYMTVDGGPAVTLSCALGSGDDQVIGRRLIAAGLTSGKHTVVITLASGTLGYFDFIEAAVLSNVPAPPGPWTGRSPASDYDTDHGYKVSPTRLLWMLTNLGYSTAELNLYMGVFWWMQKTGTGGVVPFVTIDFSQTTYLSGDSVFLVLSGEAFGKTVFPIEAGSPALIANHFAYYLNEVAAGTYATVAGSVLTITLRAVGSSYNFTFSAYKNTTVTPLTYTGSLEGGTIATWALDPTQTPVINAAASAWMADLFTRSKAAGINVVVSYSMELCFPPAAWVSLFPDGRPVTTATGFGTINSSQCVPSNSAFLAYQQKVFLATAALQTAAGLPVILQCGEHLWWYFPNASGMAYYDAVTAAAAQSTLGRALHTFLTPNDSPAVNGYADAEFLRGRLQAHVAAIAAAVQAEFPSAEFEVLYPYDVNYPTPAGADLVGGALNYFVNTPLTWQKPGTLQRIKIEALDREVSSHNLTLAIQAMQLPLGWGWPPGLVRYLIGVYTGGATWERSLLAAEAAGVAEVILFALDHVCLFGWELGDPVIAPSAQLVS
jgi:hypothetical protein